MDRQNDSIEPTPSKTAILNALTIRAGKEKKAGEPYIIGIDGMTGAGKTTFTDSLVQMLKKQGKDVAVIRVDNFHNPKSIRYGGDVSTDYYERSFDLRRLHQLLQTVKKEKELHEDLVFLDPQLDTMSVNQRYDISPDTFVIVDGIFIQREFMRESFDLKVFLSTNLEDAKQRSHKRNEAGPTDREQWSAEVLEQKYVEKFMPGFERYETTSNPVGESTILIDNTKPEHPRVLAAAPKYD